jgi:hypothetical protein
MTTALVPKSGVTGNCYAPFGSGGGGSDPLTDHDLCGHPWRDSRLTVTPVDRGNTPPVLQEGEHVHLALLCFG